MICQLAHIFMKNVPWQCFALCAIQMLVSCQYRSLSCRCSTLRQMIQCTHGFKTSACTCHTHTHTHVFVHTHVHACTRTHRGPIQLSRVSEASWSTCEHPTRWSLQRALGLASMGGSSQLCMSDTSLEPYGNRHLTHDALVTTDNVVLATTKTSHSHH